MPSRDDECKVYCATKACGCRVGLCVDNPANRKDTAEYVASWIRDGLSVSTITLADARAGGIGCQCDKVKVVVTNAKP